MGSYTSMDAGASAEYWTWRGFQMALCVWALIQVTLVYCLLPETAHPNTRGIDKRTTEEGLRQKFVWINPLGSLGLLRSPNLLMVVSLI